MQKNIDIFTRIFPYFNFYMGEKKNIDNCVNY